MSKHKNEWWLLFRAGTERKLPPAVVLSQPPSAAMLHGREVVWVREVDDEVADDDGEVEADNRDEKND